MADRSAAADDWRLCTDWLVRCAILPPDHKATWAYAEALDLVQALRDGVLLCHLLNALKKGCIDLKDFSQRPQMSQFLCLKNIRIFLQTCRTKFGMGESDLFDSYDLFEASDFPRVVTSLSRLSKCPEAAKSGISGFPPSNVKVRKDEDYYNTLEDKATFLPYDDEPEYDVRDPTKDDAEDIYGEMIYGVHGAHGNKKASNASQPDIQRSYCLKELVETENNYVVALKMVITHFIQPLKNILSPNDHAHIFMGIEKLHEIHSVFHQELTMATNSSKCSLGKCFIKWKKEFLIYGDFCSNLPHAQELVDELGKRNPHILDKITECQMRANDGKFRLRDLLSVPMQRVLKYHLLLQELKKKTDSRHPDYPDLEKALEAMQDLSWYVNEVKRDNETLQLIEEIQNSIVDLQMPENMKLKDYGKLLKDGELRVKCHGDTKNRTRYIFLFDKVMLMCKSRMVDRFLWGETYGYKNALNLMKYNVDEAPHLSRSRGQHWTYYFLLYERDRTAAITFAAKTEDMRRRWIDAINMAKENTSPRGATDRGHTFGLYTFVEPKECDVCYKMLRGVFFQGYRCPVCSVSAHKECLTKTQNCSGHIPNRVSGVEGPTVQLRSLGKCKADFNYRGKPEPSDGRPPLQFAIGDVIDILNRDDKDWWMGRLRDGSEGYFPHSFVQLLTETRSLSCESFGAPANGDVFQRPALMQRHSVEGPVRSHVSSPVIVRQYSCQSPARGRRTLPKEPDLSAHQWYVFEMSRESATQRLEKMVSGTYLVRKSCNALRKGEYALSIKFGSSVKQIKVVRTQDGMYYLADCAMFRSIPELVEYYQQNSLESVFPQLNTTLVIPYKDAQKKVMNDTRPTSGPLVLGYCIASFDYAANQPNQLSLRRGDRIAILSKAGEDRGWWKGRKENGSQVGYFPLAYVVEEGENDALAPQFSSYP